MSIYSAEDRERLVHMDLLRILAAFSVVMLHAAAQKWYSLPIDSSDWFVVNAYDAAFRFGVPIFVMISGSLFLRDRRELKLRRLYTHHVLRMMILYVIWSLAYLAFDLRAEAGYRVCIDLGEVIRESLSSLVSSDDYRCLSDSPDPKTVGAECRQT